MRYTDTKATGQRPTPTVSPPINASQNEPMVIPQDQ
jgi:hypothetical protein